MLRKTACIILTLSLLLACACDQPGFRGIRWGTQLETVKKRENAELESESPRELRYRGGTVAEHSVEWFAYVFDDEGRLGEGTYAFKDYFDSSYPEYCLAVFRDLQDELRGKYGRPSAELAEWGGEPKDYDDLLLTLAIVNGELSYTTRYAGNNTQIVLSLSKDGLSLRYLCIDAGQAKGRDRGV